jgi:Family of unknown function (DUF6283)
MTKAVTKLRRACENCPWRVDAPRGYWDPQHFVDIWQRCQDDGVSVMLCHKSGKANALPAAKYKDIPCQGWIRAMGFEAIGVRILVMQDRVTLEEVEDRDGPKLFPTFTAMMRANKIKLPKRSRGV